MGQDKSRYPWRDGAPWDALDGDAPINVLVEYLRDAQVFLDQKADHKIDPQKDRRSEASRIRADLHLQVLLLRLAAALNPSGKSQFQLSLHPRGSGNPATKASRDRRRAKERLAIHIVEELTLEKVKTEAAVAEAKEVTGLSRTAIFAALKVHRMHRDPAWFAAHIEQVNAALASLKNV